MRVSTSGAAQQVMSWCRAQDAYARSVDLSTRFVERCAQRKRHQAPRPKSGVRRLRAPESLRGDSLSLAAWSRSNTTMISAQLYNGINAPTPGEPAHKQDEPPPVDPVRGPALVDRSTWNVCVLER